MSESPHDKEREIRALAKNLVLREKGRRFILSGGCEITVDTPTVNLRALREASQLPPGNGTGDAI